jgi:hypothetical protein
MDEETAIPTSVSDFGAHQLVNVFNVAQQFGGLEAEVVYTCSQQVVQGVQGCRRAVSRNMVSAIDERWI